MFRVTRYVKSLLEPTPQGVGTGASPPKPPGPVVIWNLIRRCNLTCKHCYTVSADIDFKGELSTDEVFGVLDDLKRFRVPALILSGGEPLMRPDIFEISRRAKQLGIYTGLSTNGTLIDESNIAQIAECGYDYVGISIDGLEATHDEFRRRQGAFRESMHAVKLCKQHGIKVGLRFTLTQQNYEQLDAILALIDEHDVDKFYLSHLNYGGRGHRHRKQDAWYQMTRDAMTRLFDHCRAELERGVEREYVTGNNDADGPFLLMWARQHFPDRVEALERRLTHWGGNASGEYIANIDNLGTVHPDTFWWDHAIGNVRQRPFSEIWRDSQDALMQGFRQRPRPLKGRCAECRYLAICNGNTRVRAWKVTGDPWEEDPGCYLSNEEIGVEEDRQRRVAAPFNTIQAVEL
ncbi:heme d1 biosynthesis radical SAM protein NirJ [Halomonas desiderata]|uniref:Heme d1 biosynthesis radical SAM protein NirJ n=1 Tax=Billgrantia desiderata TaxID=52021 RepID=A0ABS9B812_9GAMM|nr:heme d1 biosynthesis radical SAM protein NirJ [Halomonas desiderata]MCE8043760.1 heme d1 biosynthesis radical SAM protein NirJ [Halomonas desiderata]MCE8048334.1 heme d1 biosynthesis radical SAM protein NirJ [Halomonas desiderata]NIC35530.1 heme d1 biosynthesis radical SAM protein NirJ [Halomonas desiderata]OUE40422.1 heme d1 biosynthesis radical SAM protein NirJ [Halomonas desiderata SP1]